MRNRFARRHRQDIVANLAAKNGRKHINHAARRLAEPLFQALQSDTMPFDQVIEPRMRAFEGLIMSWQDQDIFRQFRT